jgi:uncharacterized repeat protein (TIGR01451 family)
VTGSTVVGSDGKPLGNAGAGVRIGSADNMIGGTTAASGNLIGGNQGDGIHIEVQSAGNNHVAGNFIGISVDGKDNLGNQGNGIAIIDAVGNIVGGTVAGAANVISANQGDGVHIEGDGARANSVAGNYIGTNADGSSTLGTSGKSLGNFGNGILIESGNNTVGVTVAFAANIIGGNTLNGVLIQGKGAMANLVAGNYVGTNRMDGLKLGNGANGVGIEDASQNSIGGTAQGAGNVIAGNGQSGVDIEGQAAAGNLLQSNFIGTDLSGALALANKQDGVDIHGGSQNTVGGTSREAANVIGNNNFSGVKIEGASATGNLVQGNYIGTDQNRKLVLGNKQDGVVILSSSRNTIGGTGLGNVIAANGGFGVHILSENENVLLNNTIGASTAGDRLGNTFYGVFLEGGTNNVIGQRGAPNLVSGNGIDGVNIEAMKGGAGAVGNQVVGNLIGSDSTEMVGLGNGGDGVYVGAATRTLIADNLIVANRGAGVVLAGSGTSGSEVQGNLIGTNSSGSPNLGNGGDGVLILAASNNLIGGAGEDTNVISGNASNGIELNGSTATDNRVWYNIIRANGNGSLPGDRGDGVLLRAGAANNQIGAPDPAMGNLITGNGGFGVGQLPDVGRGNVVWGSNSIYGNMEGINNSNPPPPPKIEITMASGGDQTVQGTCIGLAGAATVQVFANAGLDQAGLAEGQTLLGTVTVTANANGDASFTLHLPAGVEAGSFATANVFDADGTFEFSQVATTGMTADLSLTESAPGSVSVGQPLSVTLTVTNNGPDPASGVVLSATLPAGETLASITSSQGSSTQASRLLTVEIGALAAGSRAMITLVFTATTAGTLTSTAQVMANESDPTPADNTATLSATVNPEPPTSTVQPLPAVISASAFTVRWSGTPGTGTSSIAAFDVFFSDNGGPFTPFQQGTTQTSATFTGQSGHTYGFYSMATDNLGQRQATPTVAQATTTVAALIANPPTSPGASPPTTTTSPAVSTSPPTSTVAPLQATTRTPVFAVTWTGTPGTAATSIAGYDIFVSDNGAPFTAVLTGTTQTSFTFMGQPGHIYGFYSIATDNLGQSQATPAAAQATTQVTSIPRPSDPTTAFVTALYQTVLNRAPDASGLASWVQFLQVIGSRLEVARGFWESAEHRGLQVDGLYAAFLHRAADTGGRAFWVAALQAGVSETDVALAILMTPEYRGTHPAAAAFTEGVYRDVLGRDADPTGLEAGQVLALFPGGPAVVAQAVLTSAEARRRLVDSYYADFLGRNADAVGETVWLQALQGGRASADAVAEGFLAADEFFANAAKATR